MATWNTQREKEIIDDQPEPFVGKIEDVDPQQQKQFEKMSQKNDWEKQLLHDLAFASIKEQRARRRWGIFFKFLLFAYVGLITLILVLDFDAQNLNKPGDKHTALIDIEGVIAADSLASADNIVGSLRKAFEDKSTQGIILRLNTPGGSPVQSGYINDEIYRLKEKYPDIPVYAVIADVCASGGYYIAAAADQIYANKASIVGSIGVIMNGFGFVEAMEKLGVSRRLYTAGKHKAFLDPFSPENPREVAHIKETLKDIHQQFIAVVKKGRGDKLGQHPELFSGFFWSGEKAIEVGLVDSLGSAGYVAREVIGTEKIKDFTYEENLLDSFSRNVGVALASAFTLMLEKILMQNQQQPELR